MSEQNIFGTINLGDIFEEDERVSSEKGNNSFLDKIVKMPKNPGTIVLRILPPAPETNKLFQYSRLHYIKGRGIHCPRPLTNGKWDKDVKCPICEYYEGLWTKIRKLQAEDDKRYENEIKELVAEAGSVKPVERYYYNVIQRKLIDKDGQVKTNVGPLVLPVGKELHKKIIHSMRGDDIEPGLGDVSHIKNGYDFLLKKDVKKSNGIDFPKYDDSKFARESTPAGTVEEVRRWVQDLINLEDLRKIPSNDELEKRLAVHLGILEDEGPQFDVEALGNKYGKSNNSSSKTSVVVSNKLSDDEAVSKIVSSSYDSLTEDHKGKSSENQYEDISIDNEELMNEFSDLNVS